MPDNRYLHLVRQDCPVPKGTHVVAYCRDSAGEEQDRSTQQQEEVIREYCAHFGLILEHTYSDDARQASSTEKRTKLQDMLLDLHNRFKQINDRHKRAKKIENDPFGILFWKSNRLGRDSIETRFIKADLRLRGITIIDLNSKGGTGDSGADAVLEAFQEWQDETFLDDSGQNASRGLAEIVSLRDNDPEFRQYNPTWPTQDGRYLSVFPGTPPTGFIGELIQIGVHDRKRRQGIHEAHYVQHIVPDHTHQLWERCHLAWKMRHEQQGIGKIHEVTRLFRTISGYSHFFENRIYVGDLDYGGKIYTNFVEALIPRDWWEEEQQRRTERAAKAQRKPTRPEDEPRRVASRHLLSGLVYCGAVDGEEHPMQADTVSANAKRSQWDFYICSHKKSSRSKRCQAPRIGAQALNEAVVDKLMTEVLTFENLRPIANALAEELTVRNQDVGQRITVAQGRLNEVRASIDKLMDALEKSDFSTSIQRRLTEREAEEHQLITEIANLETMLVKPKDITKVTDKKLNQFIESIKATLTGGEVEVARKALKQFVAKIVVNEKAGTIYYTFPLQDLSRIQIMPPRGCHDIASLTLSQAASRILDWLYDGIPLPQVLQPNQTQPKTARNVEIRKRYAAGATLVALAAEYNVSKQRIHQIVTDSQA